MKSKTTNKLFFGKYLYKVVVATQNAYQFRKYYLDENGQYSGLENRKRLSYNEKVMRFLNNNDDVELRVESPLLSIYTNNKKDIDFIINLDQSKVKYTASPPDKSNLAKGTIILPKIDFEFKVTLGSTRQPYDSFIEWAEKSDKIKLTRSCREDLLRNSSWGGTYFYITGENMLLMAKMHLGSIINKIERIVKA